MVGVNVIVSVAVMVGVRVTVGVLMGARVAVAGIAVALGRLVGVVVGASGTGAQAAKMTINRAKPANFIRRFYHNHPGCIFTGKRGI